VSRASRPAVSRRSDFKHLPPVTIEIEGEEIEFPDYVGIARGYCDAVISKRQPACKLHIAACRRYLAMLVLAEKPKNEWYFNPNYVVDYCSVAEKFEHPESGNWIHTQDDALIILEPFQIFQESAIHGFRYRHNDERVVTRAYSELPRKSAKSMTVGVAVNYDLLFAGHVSPQVLIGASTRDQCDRVFNPARMMMQKEAHLIEEFEVKFTKDGAVCKSNNGEVIKLSSQGERQDGFNPSLSVLEELHAQPESVYRVIRSAAGARPNALMRMITTAGYHASGVGYSVHREAKQLLSGGPEDYSFFALICTIDEEDYMDPNTGEVFMDKLLTDEALMMKANPMWGISLDPRKILEQAKEARRSADKRGEFLRTRYNLWNNAGKSLVDPMQWSACVDATLRLESFVDQRCWIGVDLASQNDMCAIGIVFEIGDSLAVFAQYFIPNQSPTYLDPDVFSTMLSWEQDGFLTVTDGGMADFTRIGDELRELCRNFDVQAICFDPYQSNMIMKVLWDEGLPVGRYPNTAMTMTMPADDILSRIPARKIRHDGHPVLAWNFSNLHGERKGNGTIVPRKETPNSINKIDGAVAIVMADGARMNPTVLRTDERELPKRSVYEQRGIIGYQDAK
jgi:phage terminase large subunit-like protein